MTGFVLLIFVYFFRKINNFSFSEVIPELIEIYDEGKITESFKKAKIVKQTRRTDGPRKTMKLLSGTRFQWIAYNTETKQFMGTGGGTYSTVDGVYKENIEFFSRDDSKAGLKLEFDYEIIDGDWNHKGFSSKGDPLHEIWSQRK